jgi:hypothetical protein
MGIGMRHDEARKSPPLEFCPQSRDALSRRAAAGAVLKGLKRGLKHWRAIYGAGRAAATPVIAKAACAASLCIAI